MFKALFISLGLLLSVLNPSDQIKLPQTQEVLRTFSGHCEEAQSFHLIITKNKKDENFNILPYLYSKDGVHDLPAIAFDSKPNMLSFHNNDKILTLVVRTKGEEGIDHLHTLDIHKVTGAVTKSLQTFNQEELKTVVSKKDKTVLVFVNTNGVQALSIYDSAHSRSSNVVRNPANDYFIDELIDEDLVAINTDEYVKNGSINKFKAYLNGGQLTITKDAQDGSLQTLQLQTSLDSPQSSKVNAYQNHEIKDFKKNSSFLSEDQLFQFSVDRKQMKLTVYDISTHSKKTYDLLGADVTSLNLDLEKLEKFSKKASKNRNAPTVTINPTKNGAIKARFDYVDRNYKYQQDWWWMHLMMMQQQQMMMQQQQQMMMNSLPKFGPNPAAYEHLGYTIEMDKKGVKAFEIGISTNGDLLDPNQLQTLHPKLNKKNIQKALKEDKSIEHLSTTFSKDSYTYIAYHKKSDSFKIIKKAL